MDDTTKLEVCADMFLVHAPSVFDFRERDDVLFAYLSDSDSVNVTSIYEMYPLGFLSIKQHLIGEGFQVEIINLASLMLMYPNLNVDQLLIRLNAAVFGLDLHWMAQCHGAIEIAKRIKAIHPDSLIIFGGLSATYYANELIQYPSVDVVVKGYDTLQPLTQLMQAAKSGDRLFEGIPNLVFRKGPHEIRSTRFSHKPSSSYNNVSIDWSYYRRTPNNIATNRLIMTLPNSGCAFDCGWCGGSRYAYRHIMDTRRTLIQRDLAHIKNELESLGDSAAMTNIYALQCYSETEKRLSDYLDIINEMNFKGVSFEMYHLPGIEILRKIARSTRASIMLSPESHDRSISRAAGRGNYSMEEMEKWLRSALDVGIDSVMVWFFIGMPGQSYESVLQTVAYSERLLKEFKGQPVIPLICPMVPFLDPGSRFFVEPEKYGYRIFHRTLDQHRRAMVDPLWYRRLNYESKWLMRKELQTVTYEAIARLVKAKVKWGSLPATFGDYVLRKIDETTQLLGEIELGLGAGKRLSQDLRSTIKSYNREILSYSSDQIIPIPRPFGGRWFDDFTVPESIINACSDQ